MQQFLIPSSTGSSQIINIPVSLLSQSSQQPISFITANGQIFQIPSFSQLVVHQNSDGTTSTTGAGSTTTTTQQTSTSGQTITSGNTAQLTAASVASSSTTASAAQQQQSSNAANQQQTLVINHQGQIISLPVLQPTASGQVAHQQQIQTQRVSTGSNSVSVTNSSSNNGTTPIKTLLEDDEKSDTNSIDDQGPTIANIPTAASSQPGMPHHNQITHATTVDGVNLDEIREFAKAFKLRRLALGLTQTQVGQALSATKGPAYSQSPICRFEKLDITPKSAAKIKPVLEKWMQEAELKYADRLKTGSHQNFADLLGTENTKKSKRRTSFTPQALEILNEYFEKNTHPSGNQGADMTMLAQKLNYDREVIRVWFCNKRQALKNTLKKLKSNESGGGMESSDHSDNDDSQMNTSLPSSQSIQQHQQQIIVTSQQQPQVIQVVQAGQTVASALDSASQSNELTLIKQEATNHANGSNSAKTVVTLTTNTNGPSSSSSSNSSPETDPVLLVVNAIAAGVASSNSSTNNNNNNTSSSSSGASSATPAANTQQQQTGDNNQTNNQTESTSDGTTTAANGASTSAQASNSTTSAVGGVEVATSDNNQ